MLRLGPILDYNQEQTLQLLMPINMICYPNATNNTQLLISNAQQKPTQWTSSSHLMGPGPTILTLLQVTPSLSLQGVCDHQEH